MVPAPASYPTLRRTVVTAVRGLPLWLWERHPAEPEGGAAKTTTTLHLGRALAAPGRRTLLVDLDGHGTCHFTPSFRSATSCSG
ncbi:AAA family ATPase [Streptomyces sp. NPDC052309]|uniref:ParA family protein n=1 Tax=Streptomyces sp. NPDC052309 TaxID=3155421 RepID=UPI00341F48D8